MVEKNRRLKSYFIHLFHSITRNMQSKMEKDPKKIIFCATPILFLLISFALLCVTLDLFWCNRIVPFDRWVQMQISSTSKTSFNGEKPINKTVEDQEFFNFHLARLVRGEDRRNLDETGFACDNSLHSIHCVSNKQVRIDTTNMAVYVPSPDHGFEHETVIRPYARQEDELKSISPVRMVQYGNATTPPRCHHNHGVPAVVFSSGTTGNAFHEMNEIIIPLFLTTKHLESRVQLVLQDYKPSFVTKYRNVLTRLSDHQVLNPADQNGTVHCFPGSIIGLKYHDNLALNSSDIPGGYGMSEFRQFLRQAYGLKFEHVSQIPKPRLILLSRTNTRRFLNEDELILLMKEIGFEVIVIKRSKTVSNLDKFTRLINSCSVLVGAHGAGLTNEIFLPVGAVTVQVELLGTEWGSITYYGDTARAMGVHYLGYRIEPEESSLLKLYGRDHRVIVDPHYLFNEFGYRAARTVYLDQQNVRVNLDRFRNTLVEAFSLVTDWGA